MSAIVDYSYYVNTYMGSEANETSFPALYAHASRIIGAMTRFQVDESNLDTFPPLDRQDTGRPYPSPQKRYGRDQEHLPD